MKNIKLTGIDGLPTETSQESEWRHEQITIWN